MKISSAIGLSIITFVFAESSFTQCRPTVEVVLRINQSINLLKAKGPNGHLHHSIKYTK